MFAGPLGVMGQMGGVKLKIAARQALVAESRINLLPHVPHATSAA